MAAYRSSATLRRAVLAALIVSGFAISTQAALIAEARLPTIDAVPMAMFQLDAQPLPASALRPTNWETLPSPNAVVPATFRPTVQGPSASNDRSALRGLNHVGLGVSGFDGADHPQDASSDSPLDRTPYTDDPAGLAAAMADETSALIAFTHDPKGLAATFRGRMAVLSPAGIKRKTINLLGQSLIYPHRVSTIAQHLDGVYFPDHSTLGVDAAKRLKQLSADLERFLVGEDFKDKSIRSKFYGRVEKTRGGPIGANKWKLNDEVHEAFTDRSMSQGENATPAYTVEKPAGVSRRGVRLLSANFYPRALYSLQAAARARARGAIRDIAPSNLSWITVRSVYNFVITEDEHGRISLTVGRIDDRKETGVKHVAIAEDRMTLFAGQVWRLSSGRLRFDFKSGSYSDGGSNLDYASSPETRESLQQYAEAVVGEPVEVH